MKIKKYGPDRTKIINTVIRNWSLIEKGKRLSNVPVQKGLVRWTKGVSYLPVKTI